MSKDEIFLLPGEFYFGSEYHKVRTLLGSCVAITMWNRRLKVGGMCHFKLPSRNNAFSVVLNGNYGEEAIQLFLQHMKHYMLKPRDMRVGVYGAGNMFKEIIKDDFKSISAQNINLVHTLLPDLGFTIHNESLGGNVSRRISLDLDNGEVIQYSLRSGVSVDKANKP